MFWPKSLDKKIKRNVTLAPLTSFKIGGKAKYFFEPDSIESLQEVLAAAKKSGIKVFILGAGSNILVSDFGVDGIVIRLAAEDFRGIRVKGVCVIAGSGLKLNRLILFAKDNNLSGLEFLSGIPGTLGGALFGNAGAWGSSIGKLVKEVYALDYSGRSRIMGAKELKFVYRGSNLNKYIIISAALKLKVADKNSITEKIKDYLLKRRLCQNNSFPNAGCIFKNPPKKSAGLLIDACGLKGQVKGGACISNKHANFILNTKKARSSDVLFLMDLIKRKVRSRFKTNLKPEIKIWR